MKKVTKVLMFVWRKKRGKEEFFVLHREKGDSVVLTGHVGDVYPNESLEQTVKREIKEEIGVKPKNIVNLNIKTIAKIKENNTLSIEHAFLVEIPKNEEIKFLEGEEKHGWYSVEELPKVLTYSNQRKPITRVKKLTK